MNVAALTGTNTITDSEASADDGFTTINLANTGASVIADLVAADLTALNISGSGSLILTANTLGGALDADMLYTGGAGADTITLAAPTKAITTGAGDDTVSVTVALGTGGQF